MRNYSPATFILIAALLLPASWLSMMIVHEAGHMLSAMLTGGQIEKVVLHPLAISRTDVSPNPHPVWVVWGGPLLGFFFTDGSLGTQLLHRPQTTIPLAILCRFLPGRKRPLPGYGPH
ncbi:MAG: M50 family metallopeptidase [Planctomycetaceae bacterium]